MKTHVLKIGDLWRITDAAATPIPDAVGEPIDGGGYSTEVEARTYASALEAVNPKSVPVRAFLDKVPEIFREDLKRFEDEESRRAPSLIEAKGINEKERTAEIYLTTRRVDLDNEIVLPEGMDLRMYKKNPVVLLFHNYRDLPVAKALDVKSDGFGILGTLQFAETDRGEEVWQLVKGGFLRTMSVGFITTKRLFRDEPEFTKLADKFAREWPEMTRADRDRVESIISKSILLEGSLTPIPANPFALLKEVTSGGMVLSEEIQKSLHLEQIAGLVKKLAQGASPEEIESDPPEPISVVEVEKCIHVEPVIAVRETFSPEDIQRWIENSVKNALAKRRGAV